MSDEYPAGYPSPFSDSPAVKAGKTWVKKTLHEVARNSKALMWWWQAFDQGSGGILHLLGDGQPEVVSEPFAGRLLGDCARVESARLEVRRRLEVLVGKLTANPRA